MKSLTASGAPVFQFTLYPTGEFSATKVKETRSLLPKISPGDYEEARRWDESSYAVGQVSPELRAAIVRSTLGSSNVLNSHKTRKTRGRSGITRYNKRLIVNSCLLLEKKHGRRHLGFLTLTLPSECANGSADSYREAKRQMLQWFQRTLASRGLPCEVVGCTEVQTSRLRDKSQFALHEHWIFVGRLQHKTWAISAKEIQSAWLRILGCVYQVGTAFQHNKSAVNVQRVKRSAGAYLGKYISKGESIIQWAIENGYEHCLPASWVTRSLSMLKMFKASILKMFGEEVSILKELLQSNPSMYCRWSRDLTIEIEPGFNIWIAFVGYFNSAGMELIRVFRS